MAFTKRLSEEIGEEQDLEDRDPKNNIVYDFSFTPLKRNQLKNHELVDQKNKTAQRRRKYELDTNGSSEFSK